MNRRRLIAAQAVLPLLLTGLATGQDKVAVEPSVYRKSAHSRGMKLAPPSARYALKKPASISLLPLRSEDLARLTPVPGAGELGVHRSLEGTALRFGDVKNRRTMQSDGGWSVSPDGARIWRLGIQSHGAAGVRVHFTGFAVGTGRVWIHGGESTRDTAAPFSGQGPWNNGDFWSHIVFSDAVYVEYEPDPEDAAGDSVPFQIREISHLWRTPKPESRLGTPPPRPGRVSPDHGDGTSALSPLFLKHFEGLLPFSRLARAPRTVFQTPTPLAATCQLDVSCYPQWTATQQAVALIVFESSGGTYSCSGTLLNTRNNSFAPYFLTAAHCVGSASVARTVESFWFFESAACNGPAPERFDVPSVLGARLVKRFGNFNDPRWDFSLLVLEDAPDGAVFSGWNPNSVPSGRQVAGIHHPEGEYKRITFGEAVPDQYYGVSGSYLIVREVSGRTEPGSSGSGLFSTPNVLIGTLSFGPQIPSGRTACDINPYYSGYGRFSALYPEVSDYLEDIVPPPTDSGVVLESGEPRDFSLPPVSVPTLFSDPVFRIEVPEGAMRLTVDLVTLTPSANVDLHIRYGRAPEVQGGRVVADFNSTSPTGAEQIVVDRGSTPALQAGTYFIGFVTWTRRTEISARVTAAVETSASPPATPQLGAVVHAATQRAGAVAPGQIVTLYGTNIGPAEGIEAVLTEIGRFPVAIEGTEVHFNGIPAPLFFVRHDQVNAQTPYEVAGLSFVEVRVVYEGVPSNILFVPLDASAPGIFVFLDGSNRAIVLNQDGSLNSASNPESRGRVITLFATGEGLTVPPVATGTPAPGQLPLPAPELPVSLEIGGAPAEVIFAGAAPGYVGLLQVNARIMVGANTGAAVPIVLRVGENASLSNVTMSVE